MNNEVNEVNAILNMELEGKLQERVKRLIQNDPEFRVFIIQMLLNDYEFVRRITQQVGYKLTQ